MVPSPLPNSTSPTLQQPAPKKEPDILARIEKIDLFTRFSQAISPLQELSKESLIRVLSKPNGEGFTPLYNIDNYKLALRFLKNSKIEVLPTDEISSKVTQDLEITEWLLSILSEKDIEQRTYESDDLLGGVIQSSVAKLPSPASTNPDTDLSHYIPEILNLKRSLLSQNPTLWNMFCEKIREVAKETSSFLLKKHKITWINGTSSATIPLLFQTHKLKISERPALVPPGLLLASRKIVPFSGELSHISEGAINSNAISGMELTGLTTCMIYASFNGFGYDKEKTLSSLSRFIYKPEAFDFQIYDIQVGLMRLLLMGCEKEKIACLRTYLQSILNTIPQQQKPTLTKTATALLGTPAMETGEPAKDAKTLTIGQPVIIKRFKERIPYYVIVKKISGNNISVLLDKEGSSRFFAYDKINIPSVNGALVQKQIEIDESPEINRHLVSDYEKMESVLHLFDEIIEPLNFTQEEESLFNQQFPVVFGSCTLNPESCQSGIENEKLVKGQALLGRDIQVAFTEGRQVQKLEKILLNWGVHVLSFEAARYIKYVTLSSSNRS